MDRRPWLAAGIGEGEESVTEQLQVESLAEQLQVETLGGHVEPEPEGPELVRRLPSSWAAPDAAGPGAEALADAVLVEAPGTSAASFFSEPPPSPSASPPAVRRSRAMTVSDRNQAVPVTSLMSEPSMDIDTQWGAEFVRRFSERRLAVKRRGWFTNSRRTLHVTSDGIGVMNLHIREAMYSWAEVEEISAKGGKVFELKTAVKKQETSEWETAETADTAADAAKGDDVAKMLTERRDFFFRRSSYTSAAIDVNLFTRTTSTQPDGSELLASDADRAAEAAQAAEWRSTFPELEYSVKRLAKLSSPKKRLLRLTSPGVLLSVYEGPDGGFEVLAYERIVAVGLRSTTEFKLEVREESKRERSASQAGAGAESQLPRQRRPSIDAVHSLPRVNIFFSSPEALAVVHEITARLERGLRTNIDRKQFLDADASGFQRVVSGGGAGGGGGSGGGGGALENEGWSAERLPLRAALREGVDLVLFDEKTQLGKFCQQYHQQASTLMEQNPGKAAEHVRQVVNHVKGRFLSEQAAQLWTLLYPLRKLIAHDTTSLEQLSEIDGVPENALEAIVEESAQRAVVQPLFERICACVSGVHAADDAATAAKCRLLCRREQAHFGIPPHLISEDSFELAMLELQTVPRAAHPNKMLQSVLRFAAAIYAEVSPMLAEGKVVGADEFTPICQFVVTKAVQEGLWTSAASACEVMYTLADPTALCGEGGYYLTQLTMAIHWIRDQDTSEEERLEAQEKFTRMEKTFTAMGLLM